jgi:hypothetical protein
VLSILRLELPGPHTAGPKLPALCIISSPIKGGQGSFTHTHKGGQGKLGICHTGNSYVTLIEIVALH